MGDIVCVVKEGHRLKGKIFQVRETYIDFDVEMARVQDYLHAGSSEVVRLDFLCKDVFRTAVARAENQT